MERKDIHKRVERSEEVKEIDKRGEDEMAGETATEGEELQRRENVCKAQRKSK